MKTLTVLILALLTASVVAAAGAHRCPPATAYLPASEEEIEAIFQEAEQKGLVIKCEAAATPSGCQG